MLYPIIDATTVKRTRQFVKKHYGGDTITLPDGRIATIVFPAPQAITVRYKVTGALSALFDLIEVFLDPGQGSRAICFACYTPDLYLVGNGSADDDETRAAATVGLLRSGLLKRFESSAQAFDRTLSKLIAEHRSFLEALDKGRVVSTRFLRELSASDETSLDDLLAGSSETEPAGLYEVKKLRAVVQTDLEKLEQLRAGCREITPDSDPKIVALVNALEAIAEQAETEATNEGDAQQKRKVIVFSFFADTIACLREHLERAIAANPKLAPYRERIVAVAGSSDVDPSDYGRKRAVEGFAPISSEAISTPDRFDLLLATDVLAEGVNLQQCRNVINFDIPWNPMRLVQRHGRIDRIGSPHQRVFFERFSPLTVLINSSTLSSGSSKRSRSPRRASASSRRFRAAWPADRFSPKPARKSNVSCARTHRFLNEGGRRAPGRPGRNIVKPSARLSPRTRTSCTECRGASDRAWRKEPRQACSFAPRLETGLTFGSCRPGRTGPGEAIRFQFCEKLGPVSGSSSATRRPNALSLTLWRRPPLIFGSRPATMCGDHGCMKPIPPICNRRFNRSINGSPSLSEAIAPQTTLRSKSTARSIFSRRLARREEILLREWFADESVSGPEKARRIIAHVLDTGLEPFNQPSSCPRSKKTT